jgi:hypothetical protein
MKLSVVLACLILLNALPLAAQLQFEMMHTDQWSAKGHKITRLQMDYPLFSGHENAEALNAEVQRMAEDIRHQSGISARNNRQKPVSKAGYDNYESYSLEVEVHTLPSRVIVLECKTDYDKASPEHGGNETYEVLMMEHSSGRWIPGGALVTYGDLDSLSQLVYRELYTQRYMLTNESVDPHEMKIGGCEEGLICAVPAWHCMDDATYVVVRLPWQKVKDWVTPQALEWFW